MSKKIPRNLPVGIQHFEKLVERGCLYVDKTAQIHALLQSTNEAFFWRGPVVLANRCSFPR